MFIYTITLIIVILYLFQLLIVSINAIYQGIEGDIQFKTKQEFLMWLIPYYLPLKWLITGIKNFINSLDEE